jgi:major membrane immunogen (membrane-anchored lipoprotein)
MQITSEYRAIHKTGSKEQKQITVNVKDSRLNKNRIAAKNEILQNTLSSQIDNGKIKQLKQDYRHDKNQTIKTDRKLKVETKKAIKNGFSEFWFNDVEYKIINGLPVNITGIK